MKRHRPLAVALAAALVTLPADWPIALGAFELVQPQGEQSVEPRGRHRPAHPRRRGLLQPLRRQPRGGRRRGEVAAAHVPDRRGRGRDDALRGRRERQRADVEPHPRHPQHRRARGRHPQHGAGAVGEGEHGRPVAGADRHRRRRRAGGEHRAGGEPVRRRPDAGGEPAERGGADAGEPAGQDRRGGAQRRPAARHPVEQRQRRHQRRQHRLPRRQRGAGRLPGVATARPAAASTSTWCCRRCRRRGWSRSWPSRT